MAQFLVGCPWWCAKTFQKIEADAHLQIKRGRSVFVCRTLRRAIFVSVMLKKMYSLNMFKTNKHTYKKKLGNKKTEKKLKR